MKNILTKIITVFIVVAIVVIGLKVGDNVLASASTSTNYTCGINNGWIWNGTQCVNTCDINHPWDPVNKRCSGIGYYSGATNYQYTNISCAAYGNNFYFNGSACVEKTVRENANYYSNPFNGSTTVPVYGNQNYNTYIKTQNSGYIYTETNTNVANQNINNTYYSQSGNNKRLKESIIYYNTYTNNNYNENDAYNAIYNDNNKYSSRKNVDYYIFTITTTTSQSKGTPIYLGSNSEYNYYINNWYNDGYYDIYGNYRW